MIVETYYGSTGHLMCKYSEYQKLEARIAELEAQLHQATHCVVCDKLVEHPDGALHCKECVS